MEEGDVSGWLILRKNRRTTVSGQPTVVEGIISANAVVRCWVKIYVLNNEQSALISLLDIWVN